MTAMSNPSAARTVLVTGAASGIGRAVARLLLERGDRVGAADLDAARVATALDGADPTRCLPIACDVASAADCTRAVAATVAHFGGLDALVHCAAVHSTTFWTELTAEEFNRVLAVNVTGSFLIAKAAGLHLEAQGRGAIVLTASTTVIAAGVGGAAGSGGPAYIASKAAITGLVRTMARALGPSNVRVNAVAPGVTETPMIRNYSADNRARVTASTPLGRIGTADEIAEVACFLTTEGARYMTGEVVIVNGGANFG